jgi:hypothetical protein
VVLSQEAEQLIRRLMAEARWPDDTNPDCIWVRSQAKRLSALAVNLDLWSWWFLAPEGDAILVEVGDDAEHKRHTDRGRVLATLVWASEVYSELREVLPCRDANAIDCVCAATQCELKRQGKKAFLCHSCGGLGWIPREAEQNAAPDYSGIM